MRKWARWIAGEAAAILCIGLAACTRTSSVRATTAAAGAAGEAPAGPHSVSVYADVSLRAPFTQIARAYEAQHQGSKVTLRFADGPALMQQLNSGGACDVVALADSSLMSRLAGGALLSVGSAADFARNRLALATRRGNPKNVRTLADLTRTDVTVALGVTADSIGRHARWVLSRDKLQVQPKFQETDVEAVLARVRQGEADAGIVYATSFGDAGADVERVDIPEAQNTPALYSIATLRAAKEPRGAEAFAALVRGERGQATLQAAGFRPR